MWNAESGITVDRFVFGLQAFARKSPFYYFIKTSNQNFLTKIKKVETPFPLSTFYFNKCLYKSIITCF